MRALTLVADRQLTVVDMPPPPPPGPGEVQIKVRAIALNHIDVWGYRGMAFAKRKLPLAVGAEASGEIAAIGDGVTRFRVGQPVVMYGALTCGTCKACREGRDNLCENVGGIMGFHLDGFARELDQHAGAPGHQGAGGRRACATRLARRSPSRTVQHMLFDNAKLEPGETMLVHAGGSGIGTVAIMMAKAIGCTVITTVGDDSKIERVKALGADHVINYRKDRFEHDDPQDHQEEGRRRGVRARRRGHLQRLAAVDEARRTAGDLRLRPPGRSATINLMQLFQQQYRIFGSFGASMRNIAESLDKMAAGMTPVIDTDVPLDDVAAALKRMESRQVFGKIVVQF